METNYESNIILAKVANNGRIFSVFNHAVLDLNFRSAYKDS